MSTTEATATIQPAPRSNALAVRGILDAPTMTKLLGDALGGYMEIEAFKAQCYMAANEVGARDCSTESLFRCFLACAQMGLIPGSHHKHVAIVPRREHVQNCQRPKSGCGCPLHATVVPQWQGYAHLMRQQPQIRDVKATLVHERDAFEFRDGVPLHEYDPFDPLRVFLHPSAGPCGLRGGYLTVERNDGEVAYHIVPAAKIHKNREAAETQAIWSKWFEEMCRKSIFRDAWAKRIIAVDPQLAQRVGAADAADNAALGNDPAREAPALPEAAKTSKTERIAARLRPAAVVAAALPQERAAIPTTDPDVAEAARIDAGTDAKRSAKPAREPGED